MKLTKKIVVLLLISSLFFCLESKSLFGNSKNEEKINQDLIKAGFKVVGMAQKTIPMSDKNYYLVTATKNGEELKIKVFGTNYFLAGENGKLEPINLPSKSSGKVPLIGIVFPGLVMAFAFIYIEQDIVS